MAIDPRVDRLFARAMNSPLYKGVYEVWYHGFDPQELRAAFSSTVGDDMIALFEAEAQLEDLPVPIKAFCDACERSYDVIKAADPAYIGTLADFDHEAQMYESYFWFLHQAMPEEFEKLVSSGFVDYVKKQDIFNNADQESRSMAGIGA